MLKNLLQTRFNELFEHFGSMQRSESGLCYLPGIWQKWATSVEDLLIKTYGGKSIYVTNFQNAVKNCKYGEDHEVEILFGIFSSAKSDFEKGYIFDVDLRVSGEVFGDFIGLAKEALREGHKDVAAVLACSALEDALKRYALANGLDVDKKTMESVVNALKTKGLVFGAQKSLLDTMPTIRNYAMHADWQKITAPDVSSVIGFIEEFLLSNF